MNLRANVLVIGGGPAGATAARVLAGNGIDVFLLERNLSFIKTCGGGMPTSTFEEFNIPRTTMKKEVTSIRLISPRDEEIHMELKSGTIAIVTRGEFDAVLRHLAEEQGAQVLEGECIQIVDDKLYKTEVLCGKKKTVMVSDYIVAADGVNSRVRTLLGIKPCQAIFTVSERINDPVTECCEFWFGSHHAPGFYSWVFPTAGGSSFGTGTLEQGKTNVIMERFKKRRNIAQEGRKRVYRIPLWKGDLYNKGRILFAGDSAGHVLPFTFEGIYYAMKAGELAAQAIIEKEAEKYKRMWKDRFQKKFAMMDKLKNFFFKDDASAERMVALHRSQEVKEASMRLWLQKDSPGLGLKEYIKLFGKFLS
jgi:geranylgeranyl reductase